MADNIPPQKSGSLPPLPSSGRTGKLPSPTTHLPIKKGGAGKIVVMLSSVAKPPPAGTQALPQVAPLSDSPSKVTSAKPSQAVNRPPPLPPKQVSPGHSPQSPSRLSTTTYVKLPPKTSIPSLGSLTTMPLLTPAEKKTAESKATLPPLPAKWSEPKKSGPQHIPPIKFNEPSSRSEKDDSPGESIFPEADKPAPAPKPAGWKSLEPGELNPPAGSLQSLEVFERSQRLLGKPTKETLLPEAKAKAASLVAPPLLPPAKVETPASAIGTKPSLRPPPLPPPVVLAKPTEISPAQPPPLQVAPPLLEKAPELPPEKLPPPLLPSDARKGETSSDLSGSPGVAKVPALSQPEAPSIDQPLKPSMPPASPIAKGPGSWLTKSTPLVVSSSSPGAQSPKVAEAKPALKPAVLPKRSLLSSKEAAVEVSQPTVEAPKATEAKQKSDIPAAAAPTPLPAQPPEATLPAQPPETGKAPFVEKEKAEAKVLPLQPTSDVPVSSKAKEPLPATRAERARKKRVWEMVAFYALFVVTIAALVFGSFHFGRDTRIEGQVIPPPGTTLSNEVWIVTDFSSLASGLAEDLASDRTPILQQIQEHQDHVQRTQADIASREERIRLIQEQIQASKDKITALIKQSRDDTQKIWDGEGAQIDEEYAARLDQLQKAITDRAKSLNIKYQPDNSFQSPEVWANAYRLALYEVPAGVDSVKEHDWLGDQMKQWRDFLKTLDDRKEQLREKAAQLKLAPAPQITELNTKIEELQQRVDSTAAEEVPLKTELQQAQTALADAQTTEASLDDKYYKQLYSLPGESVTKHISLTANGRFTWVDDDVFAEGEKERHYWIFARATRADGRQYWALHPFGIRQNNLIEMNIEPTGFISTKAILRPNLSPEEQEQ